LAGRVKLTEIPEAHRIALLERLTTHLLVNSGDSPEIDTSISAIIRIAEALEINERRKLAERFAHAEHAPRPLIRHFACDSIFVADPVLRWSNFVDASFLDEIISQIGDEHLQAIAQRSDLSLEFVEQLIDRGSAEVHKKVAHNTGAPLSNIAIVKLFKTAARQRAVEEALCGREDLPEDASELLMRRVSKRLRDEVGTIADKLEPPALRLALRTSDADNGAHESDTQGLSFDAFITITKRARSGRLKPEDLLEFIRKRDLGAVIACLAYLAGIHPTLARRVVLQSSSEGLAVAARAADLDRETLEALATLRREMRLSKALPERLTDTFGNVETDAAKNIMKFHSRRSKSFGLQPVQGWGI
jgi:uncharacterized protein (DUF2336 family)